MGEIRGDFSRSSESRNTPTHFPDEPKFAELPLTFRPLFSAKKQRCAKNAQKVHIFKHFRQLPDQKAHKAAQNRTFSKTPIFNLTLYLQKTYLSSPKSQVSNRTPKIPLFRSITHIRKKIPRFPPIPNLRPSFLSKYQTSPPPRHPTYEIRNSPPPARRANNFWHGSIPGGSLKRSLGMAKL